MNDFRGWDRVAEILDKRVAKAENGLLDDGQRASIRVIAERLRDGRRALLVADEVGMGKTRIAVALIDAVRQCGGRVAIVIPAGLGAQWQAELKKFDPTDRTLLPLRSYESFVRGYCEEGDDDLPAGQQERRDSKLHDRRQQRELPKHGTWKDEKILMISHAFASMRFPLSDNGNFSWRRELMPKMEALYQGRRRNIPRKSGRAERRGTHRVADAAYSTRSIQGLEIERGRDWRHVPSEDYRRAVLPVIGRTLGRFDLVVIDEAHKARGEDSSLSRILGPVIWESEDPFRLGMTATPVELDVWQWLDTLKRLVGREVALAEEWSRLEKLICEYEKTTKRLRTESIDEPLVAEFEKAARNFTCALAPYVIRRDKRSDKELKKFRDEMHRRNEKNLDYRDIRTVSDSPKDMRRDWLRAFCACEALSLVPTTDRDKKLHRLKIEKAHGLDQLILQSRPEASVGELDFWSRNASLSKEASIFEHPAIIKAVKTIEAAAAQGRKVLVFGTFIRPLEELVRLLDARAMLRHLAEGRHWPTRGVRDRAENAVRAALLAQDCPPDVPDSMEKINLLLKERYDAVHRKPRAVLRAEIAGIAREPDDETRRNEIASLILGMARKPECRRKTDYAVVGGAPRETPRSTARNPTGGDGSD